MTPPMEGHAPSHVVPHSVKTALPRASLWVLFAFQKYGISLQLKLIIDHLTPNQQMYFNVVINIEKMID